MLLWNVRSWSFWWMLMRCFCTKKRNSVDRRKIVMKQKTVMFGTWNASCWRSTILIEPCSYLWWCCLGSNFEIIYEFQQVCCSCIRPESSWFCITKVFINGSCTLRTSKRYIVSAILRLFSKSFAARAVRKGCWWALSANVNQTLLSM